MRSRYLLLSCLFILVFLGCLCGSPTKTLEKATQAEEKGKYAEALELYEKVITEWPDSPEVADANQGGLRTTMKQFEEQAPIGATRAAPLYRAAFSYDSPDMQSYARRWIILQVPLISVCETMRTPDDIGSWAEFRDISDACLKLKHTFCTKPVLGTCTGQGPWLPTGRRAADTRDDFYTPAWSSLASRTGVWGSLATMEDYLTLMSHREKKSSNGPSPVEWTDGRVYQVVTSRWTCKPGEEYCSGEYNVMHDADSDIVLGLQSLAPRDEGVVSTIIHLATGDEDIAATASRWVVGSGYRQMLRSRTASKKFEGYDVNVRPKGRNLLVTVTK